MTEHPTKQAQEAYQAHSRARRTSRMTSETWGRSGASESPILSGWLSVSLRALSLAFVLELGLFPGGPTCVAVWRNAKATLVITLITSLTLLSFPSSTSSTIPLRLHSCSIHFISFRVHSADTHPPLDQVVQSLRTHPSVKRQSSTVTRFLGLRSEHPTLPQHHILPKHSH